MHTLRLALSPAESNETELEWAACSADGSVIERGRGDPGRWRETRLVELLLPASLTLLAQVRLPAGARRHMSKLLPFAMEDRLLVSPEQVHVAAGTAVGDQAPVACIDRAQLQHALDRSARLGVKPSMACSELFLLPCEPNCWHGVVRQGAGMVRTGASAGITFDFSGELPFDLHRSLVVATDRPARLVLHTDEPGLDVSAWAAGCGGVEVELRQDWHPLGGVVDGGAINLLQGDFGSGQVLSLDWKAYRVPVALALIALLISMGAVVADLIGLSMQKKQLDAAIQAEVRKVLPVGPIVDPVLQVQRLMHKAQPAAAALPAWIAALQTVSAQLQDARLTHLALNGTQMNLELLVQDKPHADALLDRFKNAGLAATLVSSVPGDTGDAIKILLGPAR